MNVKKNRKGFGSFKFEIIFFTKTGDSSLNFRQTKPKTVADPHKKGKTGKP